MNAAQAKTQTVSTNLNSISSLTNDILGYVKKEIYKSTQIGRYSVNLNIHSVANLNGLNRESLEFLRESVYNQLKNDDYLVHARINYMVKNEFQLTVRWS